MVTVVVVMVVCNHAAIHVSTGERCSGECDCGKGRDEFDLVHGMVPFVIRASPFSRLQEDRTIQRKFLTKDFNSAKESHQTRWRATLARVAFRREGRALAHHDGKSPTRGDVAGRIRGS